MKRLPLSFFNRKTEIVARELIGKILVRKQEGAPAIRLQINETEAYLGEHDLACHASKGRTVRTEVMFGNPGTMYVHLIYGIHWMLNIVTEEVGHASGVLIRGAGSFDGPGKLTQGLLIEKKHNCMRLGVSAGIWVEDALAVPDNCVLTTPRIGINYAREWRDKQLRFVLKN
jgi:DNA-3-methyladenine glycosylase